MPRKSKSNQQRASADLRKCYGTRSEGFGGIAKERGALWVHLQVTRSRVGENADVHAVYVIQRWCLRVCSMYMYQGKGKSSSPKTAILQDDKLSDPSRSMALLYLHLHGFGLAGNKVSGLEPCQRRKVGCVRPLTFLSSLL